MVTDKEKLEHLLAGGYLIDNIGKKKLNENGMLCWEDGSQSYIVDLYSSIDNEPQWYDNIPKTGILCNVLGIDTSPRIELIYIYVKGQHYPFKSRENSYKYAKPITLEEIAKYIIS